MKKVLSFLLCLLLLAAIFAGCSSAGGNRAGYDNAGGSTTSPSYSFEDNAKNGDAEGETGQNDLANRKIIKNVTLLAETLDYNGFLAQLDADLAAAGGFVSHSQIEGDGINSKKLRKAYLVLRIPAERLDGFLGAVEAVGNVTSRTESMADVTLGYVDIESRITVLEETEVSYLALLSSAQGQLENSAEDYDKVIRAITAIRNELTGVQSTLASLRAQKNSYDDLIAYSTVTLTLSEVARLSDEDAPKTIWEEIGRNLSDAFTAIGNFFVDFFVFFVSALPYLLLIGVIVTLGLWISCRAKKRRKAKKSRENSDKNETPQG